VRDFSDTTLREDGTVTEGSDAIDLNLDELRQLTGWAVDCARPALTIFERIRPDDRRVRSALQVAKAFAEGARRTKALRDAAWDAHRAAQAARDANQRAAHEAARAAGHAAGAAFLHPLARATQVKHILGSAAQTAHAIEVDAADHAAGAVYIERVVTSAPLAVVDVLRRYPSAPAGGGRVGELIRLLDSALR
jgi:hypothetical protein